MRIALLQLITLAVILLPFPPSGSDSGLTSLFNRGLTTISLVLHLWG